MESFHFRPAQASPIVPIVIFGIGGVFALMHVVFGGDVWPAFPVQGRMHLIAWLMFAMAPLTLFGVGWAYEVTDRELVVSRFGRERYRVALSDYRDRDIVFGVLKLRFASRSVLVVSSADEERVQFLDALDARLRAVTTHGMPSLTARVAGERVTVRVDELRFPRACVCCGGEATTHVTLRAERGLDLVILVFMQLVKLEVPVCAAHARAHRNVRWAAYVGVFIATTLLVMLAMLSLKNVDVGVALLVGALVGAFAARIAEACKLSRFSSYRAIGVSAVSLDAELTRVTLRVRDPALRAALVEGGGVEAIAGVFA